MYPSFFLAAAQSPGLARSQAHTAAQEKKFDLLSDLGGDIFAAPPTQTSSSTNFANFAHFPSQSGKITKSQKSNISFILPILKRHLAFYVAFGLSSSHALPFFKFPHSSSVLIFPPV